MCVKANTVVPECLLFKHVPLLWCLHVSDASHLIAGPSGAQTSCLNEDRLSKSSHATWDNFKNFWPKVRLLHMWTQSFGILDRWMIVSSILAAKEPKCCSSCPHCKKGLLHDKREFPWPLVQKTWTCDKIVFDISVISLLCPSQRMINLHLKAPMLGKCFQLTHWKGSIPDLLPLGILNPKLWLCLLGSLIFVSSAVIKCHLDDNACHWKGGDHQLSKCANPVWWNARHTCRRFAKPNQLGWQLRFLFFMSSQAPGKQFRSVQASLVRWQNKNLVVTFFFIGQFACLLSFASSLSNGQSNCIAKWKSEFCAPVMPFVRKGAKNIKCEDFILTLQTTFGPIWDDLNALLEVSRPQFGSNGLKQGFCLDSFRPNGVVLRPLDLIGSVLDLHLDLWTLACWRLFAGQNAGPNSQLAGNNSAWQPPAGAHTKKWKVDHFLSSTTCAMATAS